MGTLRYDFSPSIVEAILLWTGWGQCPIPDRNDRRVIKRFGETYGMQVLSIIRNIVEEYYSSDAKYLAENFAEMKQLANQHFKLKYPEVPDEVLEALSWCYTFDNR